MQIKYRVLVFMWLFVVALVLSGCRPIVSKRHAGIPESAVWAGGYDGGAWFNCDVDQDRKVNRCRVYGEQSGELLIQADFRLKRLGRAATRSELRYDSFDYLNRRTIGLENGLILERVEESSNRK